ncbi:MerR family transcriptional regulator [Saccharopolyspora sp. K220]|uniref:MerR family transcriptional regulator n=1 Tax=Saccharopolyspora soli TaxID=2926618 RepID=UPI001F561DE5|nr:MerR family transcriptional regulator [Saccharopolyspora soli]MCI2423418.1 MerR family transcriptional regulator [Saccharopolyspora soli]
MDDTVRYTIGELARRTGLSVKTIRFYSDSGVVPPTDRTAAGYRRYDVTAVSRLELVRTLRELGAGLDEVQRVLARETTVSQLASTHLGLLEEQMRLLQTRRAVLRAVVKLNRSTEEVRLMHKLAQMSDEERNRLIDEFWDEVSANLNVTPGFTEWLRSAKPNLPEDPTVEQVEAWIELAELVRDPDFRRATRALYQQHSDRRDAGEPMVGPEDAEKWWAVTDAARIASEADTPPEGAEGRALADRLIALATAEWGKEDTPEFRRWLAEQYDEEHDERMSRYWELLATINNWPKHPTTAASTKWLAAALRASTQ